LNKKLQKYRAETEAEAEADHKMPFYDENTAAGGIQIDFRGSFNIFYIIKYIEEEIFTHEHTDEYLEANAGMMEWDELPFSLDDMKHFKYMKKTEGGFLYTITKEFEDDFYGRVRHGQRRGEYNGTLKDMINEEKNWMCYDVFDRTAHTSMSCPCDECVDDRIYGDWEEDYPTELCLTHEFEKAEEAEEAEKEAEKKRKERFIKIVRALQIKIKEMLYNPHTRRGRAFIKKQIEWAFE
tara:strand:+ start:87 stop:800 length:714 start_codon:yes stop_codon:yes gene_type:complete